MTVQLNRWPTGLESQSSDATARIGNLRRSAYIWNVLGLRVGHKSVTTRSQKA
jgi:hypothetical protein